MVATSVSQVIATIAMIHICSTSILRTSSLSFPFSSVLLLISSGYYAKAGLFGRVKDDQNLRKLLPPSLARRNKSFEWCHQCKQRSERYPLSHSSQFFST